MLRTAIKSMICEMFIKGPRSTLLVIGFQFSIIALGFSKVKPPSYDNEILPILEEHCFDCHGDGASKGGLSLDQWETPKDRLQDMESWKDIMKNVASKTMPPAKKNLNLVTKKEKRLFSG